jgi:cell division protease FtsH
VQKQSKFSLTYFVLLLAAFLLIDSALFSPPSVKEIPYSRFRDLIQQDKVQSVVIEKDKIYGLLKAEHAPSSKDATEKDPVTPAPPYGRTPWRLNLKKERKQTEEELKRKFTVIPLDDPNLINDLQNHNVSYKGKLGSEWFSNFFSNWIIPFGIMLVIWSFFMRRMGKGSSFLDMGKNKAKIYEADPSQKVTFDEVAGVDEAVEEVREIVAFLKEPVRFTRLGAKLPKGVLLVGPPGTGKTLLARAVAGEAGVPFFSLSGSDFVEMFVGLGAARVRDLFNEAKAKAPCIIFIDELDAIGKSRAHGYSTGGNDERENTLNQLLTEMDGFNPKVGIIMMGATNRPEVLDTALLRPGRFDRQILVDRPDLIGRNKIFEVHTRGLTLKKDVDLHRLAAETPGFTGSDIANVCNEAALLASRQGENEISERHFQEAIERVVAGLEKKNRLINAHEREIVAFHESGHAIVGHFTPGADPVQKVSIIPRGIAALGYTMQTPLEDRFLMARSELTGKVKGLLGGRAAEEIVFHEVSTGASNDLEKVAKIVRNMLTVYGMSKHAPNISLVDQGGNPLLMQAPTIARHSEKLEQMIEDEAQELIQTCYEEAKKLLSQNRDKLDQMADLLLDKEKIDARDVEALLGPRPSMESKAGAGEKNLKVVQG